MDEPFGALDPITRTHLQDELLSIQAGIRKTIVFVTHDIDEAVRLGDRIAIFAEDGTLAQRATARELLTSPATPFVESFVGAERALLLLAVTPVDRSMLSPVPPHTHSSPPDLPVIALGTPLRDALALMVLHGAEALAVTATAEQREVIGVLPAAALATLRP
ncbi:unannotated protein [freshwater metagenome]